MRRLNHLRRWCARLLPWLAVAAVPALAQPPGCDQGVVRLPDSTGTVTICSAIAARVPELSRQLSDALKAVGNQQAQLRELTRLVKGLNAVSAGIGPARQGQMLVNLSTELDRAERAGGDRKARTLDDLGEQLDGLRDQLLAGLANAKTAPATQAALSGPVGDSIARLEIRSAERQLDDIGRRLQDMQADLSAVKSGVDTANDKLDRIGNAVDPARAADRCADLGCAIQEGASAAAVRRLLEKGARVPEDRINQGEMLKQVARVPNPDRFKVLDLLAQHGLDRNLLFFPYATSRSTITAQGFDLAQRFELTAPPNRAPKTNLPGMDPELGNWNDMAGCLLRTTGGVTLMEFAALLGDTDLYRYLQQQRLALPERPLSCNWLVHGRSATPPVSIIAIDARTLATQVTQVTR